MQSPSQRLAVPDLVERFGRRDSRRRRGRAGLHRPTRRSGLVGQHQLFDKRQEHRLQQIGINFGQHVGKRLTHRRLAGKSQQMSHPRAVQFEPMHDRTNPSKPTQRGTNHGRQYGGQRMPPSQTPARIENSLEALQASPRRAEHSRQNLRNLPDKQRRNIPATPSSPNLFVFCATLPSRQISPPWQNSSQLANHLAITDTFQRLFGSTGQAIALLATDVFP